MQALTLQCLAIISIYKLSGMEIKNRHSASQRKPIPTKPINSKFNSNCCYRWSSAIVMLSNTIIEINLALESRAVGEKQSIVRKINNLTLVNRIS